MSEYSLAAYLLDVMGSEGERFNLQRVHFSSRNDPFDGRGNRN